MPQYNPHGLFIALEEIGYVMMAVSFFAVAPVFFGERRYSSWYQVDIYRFLHIYGGFTSIHIRSNSV